MTTIVTRAGKGSPLSHTEMDANLTNLNTDKVESSVLTSYETTAHAASTFADKASNLSDLVSVSTARTNLGLGSVATHAASEFATSGLATSNGNTMSTGKLLGRTTAGTGALEEISVGEGLSLASGKLYNSKNKNRIINGNFDVWQLGTIFNISTHLQKLADRWNYDYNGTIGTINFSRINLSTNTGLASLGFHPKNGVVITQSVAGSGNTFQDFSTQIESVLTLANKQVTISFYALAGAPCDVVLKTEQFFGSGGSPTSPRFNTSSAITLGTSWARYSATFTLSDVTQSDTLGIDGDDTLNVIISLPINQTFSIYIAGVQLEEGPNATNYDDRSYAEVFADCQRYIQTSYSDYHSPGTVTTEGCISTTVASTSPVVPIQMSVPMRVLPAITYYNPATGAAGSWNNAGTAKTVTTNTNGKNNVSVVITSPVSGTVVAGHYVFQDPYY